MKLFKTLAVVAVVAAPVPATAADEPGMPTTSYVGDMKVTGGPNNQTVNLKIYFSKERQRMDMSAGGQEMSVITDREAKTTTMLVPARKIYMVRPLQPDQIFTDMLRLKGATYEKVGEEACGDFTCVKYKASGTSPKGDKFAGHMWFTKDHNILMRIEGDSETDGKAEKFALVMDQVKVGPIGPKTFQVPEGYTKVEGGN